MNNQGKTTVGVDGIKDLTSMQ
ncbi:MAG: hypothetical protein MGG37_09695 [Trichodesmium sp. MAG_R01]|nr:hypothetical protein [Trichodesmium sp. MAG_R01]